MVTEDTKFSAEKFLLNNDFAAVFVPEKQRRNSTEKDMQQINETWNEELMPGSDKPCYSHSAAEGAQVSCTEPA
jgi:hypothetical protein